MVDPAHPPNPGGPDEATIDPDFQSVFDVKASSTAFINLSRYGISTVPTANLLADLESNPPDLLPVIVDKVRRCLKLTFVSEDARNRAVKHKFLIQSQRVALEIPLAERKERDVVLSLHGIPLSESNEHVQSWVAAKYKVIGSPRFIKWAGSRFYNSGRSVTISLPKGQAVVGFQNYHSDTCKAIQIQVWHPGQRMWCKRCGQCGHHSGTCSSKIVPSAQPQTNVVLPAQQHDSVNDGDAASVMVPEKETSGSGLAPPLLSIPAEGETEISDKTEDAITTEEGSHDGGKKSINGGLRLKIPPFKGTDAKRSAEMSESEGEFAVVTETGKRHKKANKAGSPVGGVSHTSAYGCHLDCKGCYKCYDEGI